MIRIDRAVHVERFIVGFAQEALNDFEGTHPAPVGPTMQRLATCGRKGTDLAYLQQLLAYWSDGCDWRKQERWLNSFDHRCPHPLRSSGAHVRLVGCSVASTAC